MNTHRAIPDTDNKGQQAGHNDTEAKQTKVWVNTMVMSSVIIVTQLLFI
jgi:hypothetical protein